MINLLPQKEKETLQQEETRKIVLILGILVLAFLISLTLIFFAINISVNSKLVGQKMIVQTEEERLKAEEIENLKKKIISLNESLSKLDSFYSQQVYLTEVLVKISQLLPTGVYLTNFSYQKNNSQIALSGYSPTRQALIELKEKLEKESSFQQVFFPTSNWVKPKAIDFSLTLKLTK